jgi:hypothetical protein
MLNPLHRLHRLASDIMVPDLIFNDDNNCIGTGFNKRENAGGVDISNN